MHYGWHVSPKTLRFTTRFQQQMNEKTFNIRKAELLRDINKHPHKDELLNIMQQQLAEDCVTLDTK